MSLYRESETIDQLVLGQLIRIPSFEGSALAEIADGVDLDGNDEDRFDRGVVLGKLAGSRPIWVFHGYKVCSDFPTVFFVGSERKAILKINALISKLRKT